MGEKFKAVSVIECLFIKNSVIFILFAVDDYFNVQPWGDLHILHADIADSGVYTCTAYASDVFQSASAVLTVSHKGDILTFSLPCKNLSPEMSPELIDLLPPEN